MFFRNPLANIPEVLTYDDVLLLPQYSEVDPDKIDLSTQLSTKTKLKIPIIASLLDTVCEADMAIALGKLGGLGIIHHNLTINQQVEQIKQIKSAGVITAAAIGIDKDFDERLKALVTAGVQILCLDSAHGHSKETVSVTKKIKQTYPNIELISGNVATYDGAMALFTAGADIVRVGLKTSPNHNLQTLTGVGVPPLTAVMATMRAAKETNKHIIADGGIRSSGDIVKALALGAHTVMISSLLSEHNQTPKHLQEFVNQLVTGIKQAMIYLGAANLTDLVTNAKFVKITSSSLLNLQTSMNDK